MSSEPPPATNADAVWRLHEDVSRLFKEMTDLHRFLDEYMSNSEGFLHVQDEVRREVNSYIPCGCFCWPICRILGGLAGLAALEDGIRNRQSLFLWFAMSYDDRPPGGDDEVVEGRPFDSYHRSAHHTANRQLRRLLEEGDLRAFQHGPRIDDNELERILGQASGAMFPEWHSIDVNWNIQALRIEAAHAVTLIQKSLPGTAAIGAEGANDDPPVAGQEDNNTVDAACSCWLYERRQNDLWEWRKVLYEYDAIRETRKWPRLTPSGVRSRVARYARDRGLPLRRGKGGAPKRKK